MRTNAFTFLSSVSRPLSALLLSLTLAVSSLWAQDQKDAAASFDVRHVNASEASEVLNADPDIRVLDVRTGWEYGRGHLDGAVNVNYYSLSFRKNLDKLDKDVTWLVHCKTGVRSGKTLPIMQELGFKHVVHMDGGIDSWREAGLPTVK